MAISLEDGLGLNGDRCMRDTPTSPFHTERRGFACMQRNYYMKYVMVLKGLSNATDLNVLQGKAYENLADLNTFKTSMSLRD